MKYVELIFCKLVWFHAKFIWFSSCVDGENRDSTHVLNLTLIMLMMLPGTPLNFERGILYLAILPVLIYAPIWWYLKRVMKERRIIYNKEYMQSKQGVLLVILYVLICIGISILGFWAVRPRLI